MNGRRYVMRGLLFKIHLLRFADNIPVMIEVGYVSVPLCPGIDKQDFTGSLYEI